MNKEQLKQELIKNKFLEEEQSTENFFKIGNMEDSIMFYNNYEEFEKETLCCLDIDDVKKGLEEKDEFYITLNKMLKQGKKHFENNKKIVSYIEWGKCFDVKNIRELLWKFLEHNKDYVLMMEYSDSNETRLENTLYVLGIGRTLSAFIEESLESFNTETFLEHKL